MTRRSRVSETDLLVFTRHLNTMVGAGIPIVSALTICRNRCENKTLAQALEKIRKKIADGSTIADALIGESHIFSPTYRALVEAGEGAGILERSLECLVSEISARIALRRHAHAAAIYPLLVLFALIMVTVFLLIWVVPTFEDLFADIGADLPWLTKVVLSLSRFVSTYGFLISVVSTAFVVGMLRAMKQNRRLAERAENFARRIPIIRSILALRSSARMSSTLGALIQSGIPIIDALDTTSRVVGSRSYTTDMLRVRDMVANGSSLSDALRESSSISPVAIDYIAIGEQSGRLQEMLHCCAMQLERDLSDLIRQMNQFVEPILIVTIGGIVGILVLAMYMPIFQIGELLSH